jgi:hypothetical protein
MRRDGRLGPPIAGKRFIGVFAFPGFADLFQSYLV